MSEWISVKDRLPDDDAWCLVIYKSFCASCRNCSEEKYRVGIGLLFDNSLKEEGFTLREPYSDINKYLLEESDVDIRVSHWMPLPKPPEEE
ncbi:MAG TPA: DUF551 domain-containing protein [Candidatus Babeliales bacterium]|nr:DUF551 domain-containing protein [Candidatus Babeliales bacterium]